MPLTDRELLEKIHNSQEKVRKYILWGRVLSFINFLLIVVPIVLGLILIPPLLKDIIAQYTDTLESVTGEKLPLQNPKDVLKFLEQYKESAK